VAAVGWAAAILLMAIAMRHTRRQLGERQVPLMGVLAAFIFAAQAVNFPVAAGTSGHLVGAALAAIVVGPWAGTLIMTAVIVVQGLLFQDGGLLAMGWNLVNMGVLSAFVGFAGYSLVTRVAGDYAAARTAASFAGAWLSVEAGAVSTAIELAASGTTPLFLGLPAMASVHALIGLGEGLITAGAVALLQLRRGDLLQHAEAAPGQRGSFAVVALALLALAAVMLSPLASASPDGLAFVAEQQGFQPRQVPSPGLFEGYALPDISNPAVATLAAIGIGAFVVLAVSLAVGWAVSPRSSRRS
jgi:cobalt/nickel transport system permease protein